MYDKNVSPREILQNINGSLSALALMTDCNETASIINHCVERINWLLDNTSIYKNLEVTTNE